jgi:hypothetical protein
MLFLGSLSFYFYLNPPFFALKFFKRKFVLSNILSKTKCACRIRGTRALQMYEDILRMLVKG